MAAATTTKSIQHILEDLVLGTHDVPSQASAAAVPVKGLYVISFTADLASQAANTATEQEFTITDTTNGITVAIGDLFVPFAWSTLNAGLSFAPAAAKTAHKACLYVVNSTVGALDAASATVTALWVKTA